MHADPRPAARGTELRQHLDRISDTEHQRLAEGAEIRIELRQAFTQKFEMTSRHVGLAPQFGLEDVERDHRTMRRRRRERCVILDAKVALVPDYLHDVPHLYPLPQIGRIPSPQAQAAGGARNAARNAMKAGQEPVSGYAYRRQWP